jgi:hypothetical protein
MLVATHRGCRGELSGLLSSLVHRVHRPIDPAFAALDIAAWVACGIEAMDALAVTAFAELRFPFPTHLYADHDSSKPQCGVYVTGNLAKALIEVTWVNAFTGEPELQDFDIFWAIEDFAREQPFHEHA